MEASLFIIGRVSGPFNPKAYALCSKYTVPQGWGARKGYGVSLGAGKRILPYKYLTTEMTLKCSFPVGIKDYSNWPTIPQVYLNGEFVGGCDILLQMHQNGDLVEELKKLGIRSALLDEKKDQDSK